MPCGCQEINPEVCDGEVHVPQRLRCIEQEKHAPLFRKPQDIIDRLDRPRDVRDVSQRDKLGIGSDRRADSVRIDPSGGVAGDSSDVNYASVFEPTERTQHGVVLGGRRDNVVVASEDPMEREIERVRTVKCENYLIRTFGMDQTGYSLTSGFDQIGNLFGLSVTSPTDSGAQAPLVVVHSVIHDARFGPTRGRIIQVNAKRFH